MHIVLWLNPQQDMTIFYYILTFETETGSPLLLLDVYMSSGGVNRNPVRDVL